MITLNVLATGSSGNCYLLNCDGKILILDAGIPTRDIKRGLNYDLLNVVGCFITHTHLDHSLAADYIRMIGIPMFEPYKSEMERRVVTYDGFVIKSFKLPHDGVENCGAYIICPNGHRLLYMTDFEYSPYVFRDQKINTMLIECNYCKSMIDPEAEKYNHVLRGHASLDVVKEFVRVNRTTELKNIILCHLSNTSADEAEIMREITSVVDPSVDVTIARRGLTFELDKEF